MSAPGKEWIDYDPERQKERARGLLRILGPTRPVENSLARRIGYWRSVLYAPNAAPKVKAEARRILEKLGAAS